jgi:hypothetical protein
VVRFECLLILLNILDIDAPMIAALNVATRRRQRDRTCVRGFTQRLRRLIEDGIGYGLALEGISAAAVAPTSGDR